jgi:uncharacterized protein (TIGR03437 family)
MNYPRVRAALFGLAIATELAALAQTSHPGAIQSISVCSNAGSGDAGSCPSGTFDTHQIVLAPDGSGNAINGYQGMVGISDEHQSVFPPGALEGNSDYLFVVATRTQVGAPSTGVVFLSGGSGPGQNGQWTMDFAKADGYNTFPSGYGQIFVSPAGPNCPTVAGGDAAGQDQTFDLKYAASGSVVIDPTAAPGNLLMIYEGTNTCLGSAGGPDTGNFYSEVAVATSLDYGHNWPTYRAKSGFNFVPLPAENPSQGPSAPTGATGASVCAGNDCTTTPAASFGRYPVLGPSVSIGAAAATGVPLPSSMGDSEMSAFVDGANVTPAQYIYAVYDFKSGTGALADPKAPASDMMMARARLNGGTAPLSFLKWNGQAFAGAGLGGYDSPIFPAGPFANCEGAAQLRYGGSISYVDATQQYLLLFVCDTPGDPAAGQVAGAARGGAWFYSTSSDIADPTQWSPPKEIAGSWSAFDESAPCSDYKGFYPTMMSLGAKPGHISTSGYVFYLWGCQTDQTPPPGRQYSSRAFIITTGPPAPDISLVANAEGESPTIAPNTWVEIKGTNLAPAGDTRIWQTSDFVGGKLPPSLDGVSVTVNGNAAYVYYISPTQVNVLTPPPPLSGSVPVVLTVNGTASAAFTVQAQSISPSFFVIDGGPYVVAQHAANFTLVGPTTLYPGSTTPAKPGETVVIYANGFGMTSTPVVGGSETQSGTLSPLPSITIGGVAANVQYAALVSPGLFQFNVVVPASLANGDQPITATYNGFSTQAGCLITVHQ